jgi:hypothetical protein
MGRPIVITVGADKGGVGKTAFSRVLMDYLPAQGLDARAFDTQVPKGVLKRFHPAKTELVDISTLGGKMRVFDTINSAAVSVVDLAAGLLSPTVAMLRETGFVDMVSEGLADFVVFHVVGNSVASLDELKTIAEAVKGMKLFVVSNPLTDTPAPRDAFEGHVVIDMPKLNDDTFKAIDQSNLPYSEFIATTKSYVMKGYAKNWLATMYSGLSVCRFGR